MSKFITSSSNSVEIKIIILLVILFYEKSNHGSLLSKINYFYYIIKHRINHERKNNNITAPFEIETDLKPLIRLAEINGLIKLHIKKNNIEIRYSLTDKGRSYITDIKEKHLFTEIFEKCKHMQSKIPQTKINNYLMVWK